ncbi:hypothetical protein [Acetobacterium woodii]|uniref:Putative membrane protein n=1 Tax=Acetobacterium woodii (strain ATCC 29683 / DSM 1030 / JCM 2381 / KCTC 1655 / WB1) TaxID=931626 RepID=H6LIT0_ACEWD|nr:hypothetical protein [Acetobacterium woodii]AFA49819.1 putative membrane protein [Acetobacterium woodii DSM 1030]
MGRARLNGQSGGLKINGVEADCIIMSEQTIAKGDFVEFVRSAVATSSSNPLGTGITIQAIEAVKLTDNKIFVVYTNRTDFYHYAIVVQINSDGTLSNITPTPIKASSNVADQTIFLEKVSDTQVVFCYSLTSQQKYVVLMSFNGTAITVGSHYSFTASSSDYIQGISVYDSTHVIVFFYSGSAFFGVVLTISGNNVLARGGTVNIDSSYPMTNIRLRKMQSGKILLLGNRAGYVAYCFLTLIGATLTSTTVTLLVSATSSQWSPVFMSDSLVYAFFTVETGKMSVFKITINDGASTATYISTDSFATDAYASRLSCVALSDTKILMTYAKQSNNYPSMALINIAYGFFQQEFSTYLLNIATVGMSKLLRRTTKIADLFLMDSNYYYLYSKVAKIEEYGRTSSMIEKCNAVAKSGGSSLQNIKVIKLTGGL